MNHWYDPEKCDKFLSQYLFDGTSSSVTFNNLVINDFEISSKNNLIGLINVDHLKKAPCLPERSQRECQNLHGRMVLLNLT